MNNPRLWVCYKLRNGELRVECLEGVPDGDGIDMAFDISERRQGQYVYCSRERVAQPSSTITEKTS
jgi:hypothetical protein